MEGLGLAVGIKAYCPPGTGNCRNRPGDCFPGTAWIGQYWRQDASRQDGARRMEDPSPPGVEAPTAATTTTVRQQPVTVQCRELQCWQRVFPVCQTVLPFLST